MALSGSFYTSEYKKNLCFEFKWNGSQSITDNSTTINWQLIMYNQNGGSSKYYCAPFKVVINGVEKSSNTRVVLRHGDIALSGSQTIYHNDDGTMSFDVYAGGAIYYSSINSEASNTYTLNRIPRYAKITSAPNFTDEENPTIYYSNPAGSAVKELSATIWLGKDTVKRELDKNGSSYTFQLTNAERVALRKQSSKANSATMRFYIGTLTDTGTSKHWEYVEKTLTIVNNKPTLSPTVKDTNATMVALTGNNQVFVKGYSNAYFTVGSSANKEAWISTDYFSNGSQYQYGSTGTIYGVDNPGFYFWTKDSRGNTTETTITKSMIDYIPLSCNMETKATISQGNKTNIDITISGSYFNGSFGKVQNGLSVWYRYKINGGSYTGWQLFKPTVSGNYYKATHTLTGFNYKDTITVQGAVADSIYNNSTPYKEIDTVERAVKTTPVFDWGNADFNFNVPVNVDGRLDCKSLYINGSAYQPPKPVITPNDYVVASGTTSGWGWRKWNSGIGECWSITQLRDNQLSCSGGWGSCYYGSPILSYQYPITFTETPQEIANIRCSNDILFYRHGGGNTKTTSASYGLFSPSSVKVGYAFIEYYVIGKYK